MTELLTRITVESYICITLDIYFAVKHDPLNKIGQVAEILDVSLRTIRYYEELGLIKPYRTEKGTRLYSKEDIERLRTALTLREHGMNLEEITCLATTRKNYNTGQEASQQVLQMLKSLQTNISERIQSYQALGRDLDRAILLVGQCSNCKHPPTNEGCPDCPVAKHKDESSIAGLIWEAENPQNNAS